MGSAAIDAGPFTGVLGDSDGDIRPIGPRVDISFDEFGFVVQRLYPPAIMR